VTSSPTSARRTSWRSRRDDGTLRPTRTIWVVPYDGGLYVRSINGPTAAWYRGTRIRHEGHVTAGGVDRDVTFVDVADDTALNDAVDAAYRQKYRRYAASIVDSIVSATARSTTIRLVPQPTDT
jgi:hypothetical protein